MFSQTIIEQYRFVAETRTLLVLDEQNSVLKSLSMRDYTNLRSVNITWI